MKINYASETCFTNAKIHINLSKPDGSVVSVPIMVENLNVSLGRKLCLPY